MSDLWSWNNAIDAAGTLMSSDVGSSGELLTTNLLDPRIGRIWRAGDTAATLSITLPISGPICLFGLFGLNYAALGDITLKLGTFAGGGDLWETTFTPSWKQAVYVLRDELGEPAPVSASHATISVVSGDPLEIGRVWLGTTDWQTEVNHVVDGSGWQGRDLSFVSRARRTGGLFADVGNRLRSFTATYRMLSQGEALGTLFDMDDRGVVQQMLFVPNPDVYDSHRQAICGYLDELPATSWETFAIAGRSITITEAG